MDSESYRVGFEAALELCIFETKGSPSREVALVRMMRFLDLVKADKMGRVREMLLGVGRG